MWLHVPGLTSSPSARESEVLTSESMELSKDSASLLAQCVMWRGKHMQARFWSIKWEKEPWIRRLSGLTSKPSTLRAGVDRWMRLLRDFPASPSRLQGKDSQKTIPATSGLKCSGCSKKAAQGLLFSRTSPALCGADCAQSSKTFPARGSMRNGVATALRRRERSTRETDCLSLPTLTAQSYGSNKGGAAGREGKTSLSLQSMAKSGLLPTLTVKGNHNKKGLSKRSGDGLAVALRKLMPTLTTQDAKNNGGESQGASSSPPLNSVLGGPLNPEFCEEFMGFEISWTDLSQED